MSDKTVPNPPPTIDPTLLTTQQLLREIDGIAKLLRAEYAAANALLNGKIDAVIAEQNGDREVRKSRFESIDRQFDAIEAWRKEQKLDTKTAVDAALQAAEKAVREQTVASEKSITKSETSANEQSKQQYATFTASLKGVSDTLQDVKERVAKIESAKLATAETRVDQRQGQASTWVVIGGVLGLVIFVMTVITFVATRNP